MSMLESKQDTLKVGDKFQNFEYDEINISEVEVHVVGQHRSVIKFPNPYIRSDEGSPPYYIIVPNHTLYPKEKGCNVGPGDYVACVFRNECVNGLVINGTNKTWNVALMSGEATKGSRGLKRVKKSNVFLISKAKQKTE